MALTPGVNIIKYFSLSLMVEQNGAMELRRSKQCRMYSNVALYSSSYANVTL
jgi:hypothetical protein